MTKKKIAVHTTGIRNAMGGRERRSWCRFIGAFSFQSCCGQRRIAVAVEEEGYRVHLTLGIQ